MSGTQPQLLNISIVERDAQYTPAWVVDDMIEFFKPTGKILDPCKGNGEFFDKLPAGAEWCEIEQGRDFYSWNSPVDWIIGNPPYSLFAEWMRHSYKLANNIVYLIAANKPYNGIGILHSIFSYGGIVHQRYYGAGAKLGFTINFPSAAVHFRKDYTGPTHHSFANSPTQSEGSAV